MLRLPEDLKLAIEGLHHLEEKFLRPLSRLDQILRVCVESHERINVANLELEKLQKDIEQAQQSRMQLDKIEASCAERRRELQKLFKDIEIETKRLQDIRDRIKRAQTLEP